VPPGREIELVVKKQRELELPAHVSDVGPLEEQSVSTLPMLG
jgi:hypothetical protein